ncbi:MAG: FG-GAP repeat domain-containing protein, partial [Flavobacteriales bacterium]
MNAQVFSDGDPEGLLFSGHTGGYLGQGVSCVDFNNDGLDDLTFTQYEGQLLAYTNEGQGTFLPTDLGVSEYLIQPKAVYWVDLDNDGDKDLFVTQRLAKNELFVRIDGGDLVRVPDAGGLGMAGTDRTYGASMADFDNDGLLDVYLCNYHSPSADNATNALLRNMGGVDLEIAFEDVTESSGTGNGIQQSFQSTWVDVDRDGWLDLHVVNDRLFWPDVLFRNNGDGTFQDMASDWGLAVEAYSMSSSFADFDKDQDWDVVSTNGANEGNHFRRCVGQPFVSTSGTAEADLMYEEVASEAGILLSELAWGANWFDADNDGWLDLYIATGTSLYSDFPSVIDLYPNSTNGLFMNDMGAFPMEDASDAVNPFNELTFSVGCADFNLDGALDLVSHQIGTHAHLMNGVPNGNHWVSIALEASQGCPDAIGAVVTC